MFSFLTLQLLCGSKDLGMGNAQPELFGVWKGLCETSRLIAKKQGIGQACLPVLCTRSGKLHAFGLQKL